MVIFLTLYFYSDAKSKHLKVCDTDNEPVRGFVARTPKQNSRQAIEGIFVFYISRKKYSAFNPAKTCPLEQPVQNNISAPEKFLNFILK